MVKREKIKKKHLKYYIHGFNEWKGEKRWWKLRSLCWNSFYHYVFQLKKTYIFLIDYQYMAAGFFFFFSNNICIIMTNIAIFETYKYPDFYFSINKALNAKARVLCSFIILPTATHDLAISFIRLFCFLLPISYSLDQ